MPNILSGRQIDCCIKCSIFFYFILFTFFSTQLFSFIFFSDFVDGLLFTIIFDLSGDFFFIRGMLFCFFFLLFSLLLLSVFILCSSLAVVHRSVHGKSFMCIKLFKSCLTCYAESDILVRYIIYRIQFDG